jgi:hypothetical protein
MAKDNPTPDHRAEVIDGRMIDLCDLPITAPK